MTPELEEIQVNEITINRIPKPFPYEEKCNRLLIRNRKFFST